MRRIAIAVAACAAPGAAAALAACVSGGQVTVGPKTDATTTTMPEAGDETAPDAPAEASLADVCGSAPWVNLGLLVVGLTIEQPDGEPLPGVEFTSPLCPGLAEYSNDAGAIQGKVSANVPFYGRLQASGFIPELTPEEEFDADSTGNKLEMIPTLIEGVLLPTYDASGSTAIVLASETLADDAGACSQLDGITFSVPGHPEAQVTYYAAGSIPTPIQGATATSTSGMAAITGLSAGPPVRLAGTKTGCTVVFGHGSITGRTPLENGYVSLMPAYLSP